MFEMNCVFLCACFAISAYILCVCAFESVSQYELEFNWIVVVQEILNQPFHIKGSKKYIEWMMCVGIVDRTLHFVFTFFDYLCDYSLFAFCFFFSRIIHATDLFLFNIFLCSFFASLIIFPLILGFCLLLYI